MAYDESDPIIDLYPKKDVPAGSMGGVGKGVSTVRLKESFVVMTSLRRRWE